MLVEKVQTFVKERGILLLSLFIALFIFLQTVAAFGTLCPPHSVFAPYPRVYKLLYNCGPGLWPFMTYDMYSRPKYVGDTVSQRHVIGILADSTEVELQAKDLGLDRNLFGRFMDSLVEGDEEQVNAYARVYENKYQVELVALRLEDHPLILTAEEFRPARPRILADLQLEKGK